MRVRFAPSPTGALHIGGARTALFNWLLRRAAPRGASCCGSKIPTASARRRRTSSRSSTRCAGSSSTGMRARSSRASARRRHREAVAQLLAAGQRLPLPGDRRGRQGLEGDPRRRPRASAARRTPTAPCACASPTRATRSFEDLVLGEVRSPNRSMDDLVIARADGTPLYNLAVAVDDLDLEITHVVRGKDHLTNTAKQLLVIRGARRRAATLRPPARCCTVPTARSSPSATAPPPSRSCATPGTCRRRCDNYIALLGWGAGDDETILSTQELVRRFDSRACSAIRRSSTRASCAGSTAATCAS